ncbi:hypothetical protein ES708_25186 [subsurface metagenome]
MAQGKRVDDCPIEQRFCYSSCYFWRDGRCEHQAIMAKDKKEKRREKLGDNLGRM